MLTFSLDKIALQPHSKVLDVGCGEGRHIFGSLHEYVDVHCIGLDQDIPSLNKCKEGFEFFKELNSGSTVFMQGSVYSLPFDDNTFDLVICSEVLEHLDDYHAAIDEIYRVLNNNGIAILQVPININRKKTFEDPNITSQLDREKYFGQYDHVREYGIDFKTKK